MHHDRDHDYLKFCHDSTPHAQGSDRIYQHSVAIALAFISFANMNAVNSIT